MLRNDPLMDSGIFRKSSKLRNNDDDNNNNRMWTKRKQAERAHIK